MNCVVRNWLTIESDANPEDVGEAERVVRCFFRVGEAEPVVRCFFRVGEAEPVVRC